MAIRFCKNRNCTIVLNEYNMDCSCIGCNKEIKYCNGLDCADKGARLASDDARDLYMRKCHGCINFSKIIMSQRNR